jgi:ferredoxin
MSAVGTVSHTIFESYLNRLTKEDWSTAIAGLLPSIHAVDQNATQIWFAFFPLDLFLALQEAEDPRALAGKLLLQGKYYLKDQIDSSHHFLYGHRYWPEVRRAVVDYAESNTAPDRAELADHIRAVAGRLSQAKNVDVSLLTGITAVAFMTLRQVGLAALKASPGTIFLDQKRARKSPDQVLRERARDDSQGLFGFLRTTDKVWTVTFNENDPAARFKMMHLQEIASAAATDRRDWSKVDERCHEGPIPVQCRSASCGTCWVGVLGGAEKLTAVAPRERRQMKDFGYIDTDDPQPLIRLSCQAQGTGAVSIVIPPWNGFFGKFVRQRERGRGAEAATAQE